MTDLGQVVSNLINATTMAELAASSMLVAMRRHRAPRENLSSRHEQ
jgi:phosphoglycerate dehydrogenase-like enzyme